MRSSAFRAAVMLLVAVLLCIACNAVAVLIDTTDMRGNAWQGALMLCQEGATPQLTGGFKGAQLDNFTSVLILKTAAYTGEEDLLTRTFGGMRTDMPAQDGESHWEAFCQYADGSESPTGGLSYTRYWHGYTLPLRLLLCVLDLANIQMLLFGVQLALWFGVLALMVRRGLHALIPGMFLSYFLLVPSAVGVCLQYIPVTLLTLLACAALLSGERAIDRAVTLPGFFALIGLLTNYVDLLTFPLLTLGFPLVMLLAMRLRTQESGGRLLALTIACCAAWAVGFGGMWVLKWVLTAAVFGWERLGSIVAQATLRASSGSNGETFSRLSVVVRNFDVFLAKASYLLLIGLAVLATLAPAVRRAVRDRHVRLDPRALTLLVVLAVPIVWYLVLANHAYDHTYYTYRNATVSVLAGYALLACLPAADAQGREEA